MKINHIVLALSLVALSASLLTGCQNTVEGFGKDMQQTGQNIEKSANK